MTDRSSEQHVRVAIVGTGFAGLGMAIRLLQSGERDLVLVERAHDVGGTWRDNTYPGCECDVPSRLYSFSFALNPNWTRSYAGQPEILAYLQDCAQRFGVMPYIRFGEELLDAVWDDCEPGGRWRITTTNTTFTADVLVSGHGSLSEPHYPEITGLDRFEGTMFHSAAWRHDHDVTGERVAVIGTGASSIQFVPIIQPEVARLTVFQRTAPWILPRGDQPVSRRRRRVFEQFPGVHRLARAAVYWAREVLVLGLAKRPQLMRQPEKMARAHLEAQVRDPGLRRQLTPTYSIGCKRILLSDDYYPAITRPNVDVITAGIDEVRAGSIVTHDGIEHEIDTIILGTGFRVTGHPIGRRIRGRTGQTLAETWVDGMEAYRGTTVAGFPNLFMLAGPNTGLGHTSMVVMLEAQFDYVLDCLDLMNAQRIATVEVRPEVQASFNDDLHRQLSGTVWNSGCASWYLDERGRNTAIWPTFTFAFRRLTRRFDADAYRLGPARRSAPSAAAAVVAPDQVVASARPGG
jgi:cation diffusion facilitator CzcD-associated flavoprotein CzcO